MTHKYAVNTTNYYSSHMQVSPSFSLYACCSLDIPHRILFSSTVDLRFSVTVRDTSWMLMLNFVLCEEKRNLFLTSVALEKTAALFDLSLK